MLIYGKSTYLLLVTAIKLHNLPHPLINGSGTLLAAMHNLNSLRFHWYSQCTTKVTI